MVKQTKMTPERAARIKANKHLEGLPPIKTSLAILAEKGSSPVNRQAVNVLKASRPSKKPKKRG
ncbi:hypothetical protein [Caulobacter sp.]|jgi:hypothetical protein|uniref:hypothetical protein n=1 Tax=Caulobacter sp. TaxID=78 RepID=UPI0031DE62A6